MSRYDVVMDLFLHRVLKTATYLTVFAVGAVVTLLAVQTKRTFADVPGASGGGGGGGSYGQGTYYDQGGYYNQGTYYGQGTYGDAFSGGGQGDDAASSDGSCP